MYVHAYYSREMGTPVEITDEHRALLLKRAAERGEKGLSRLVQEALELYLREKKARQDRVKVACATLGSFSEKESESLRRSVQDLRGCWR